MVYHVLLEGRTVGPYDRRTIVGMRIKQALASENVLIGADGGQLTVADLIGRKPAPPFNPNRSGSFSVVQAAYTAGLVDVQGWGLDIPRFKGEVEVRVQGDVLRLAGRFRKRLRWKEDRVKIALANVVHARLAGSQAQLWLRNDNTAGLQRIVLELFTPEAAGELVDWLPAATPYPQSTPPEAQAPGGATPHALWIAAIGVSAVVVLMVLVLLYRRIY